MPAPYHSIEERLNRYQTGLTNACDVPEQFERDHFLFPQDLMYNDFGNNFSHLTEAEQ
ncbi:MAG: hypothetical protein WGN25_19475 [Candidatus Electrothrix sp. GW3-4]|uniref:hypothetical protein n=1 Tax=Candidatus Electrothrix sp. GW3-4 TaxID=3126740 RepID=UPI0030CF88BD